MMKLIFTGLFLALIINEVHSFVQLDAAQNVLRPPIECPLYKCRANCGSAGYKKDENGCQTCACAESTAPKQPVECSKVQCRMYCMNGFRRDENGCEICSCNTAPAAQPVCPILDCLGSCPKGYKKDSNGCTTCECEGPDQPKVDNRCPPMQCALNCKYGFERDSLGCELCSCNQCPQQSCRMFCMFGSRLNSDGCEVCECDWTPIAEKIPCSERIPCIENRVCNLNLKMCELVPSDRVNWFVYDFQVKTELFRDPMFLSTFKSGLIQNIATKYELEPTQITVSAIERDGMTSFQIMPFYSENMEDFQRKIDQIDADLNTHEFRAVLPAVASVIGQNRYNKSTWWKDFSAKNPRMTLYALAVVLGFAAIICATFFVLMFRRHAYHPNRSESKSPIFDSSYQQAPTEDDQFHAVHAPDGTAYVVVESEDIQAPNDKRALV